MNLPSHEDAKWCYLLIFDEKASSHECMKTFLDRHDAVLDWTTFMPRTFLLVSSLIAKQLSDLIRTHTLDRGNFLVMDVATDRSGWLPKSMWAYMRNNSPPQP